MSVLSAVMLLSSGGSRLRLRTRLTVILVAFLGLACLVVGVSSYWVLSSSLMNRAYGQLDETAHRAVSPGPGAPQGADDGDEAGGCEHFAGRSLVDAPGQGPGTLTLCTVEGQVQAAGLVDASGTTRELGEDDRAALLSLPVGEPQELELQVGSYLVLAQAQPAGSGLMVTGVPLAEVHRTLAVLVAVMAGGSLVAMVGAGALGRWVIGRTMQPLERVSQVAADVATLNLASDALTVTSRVRPEDSQPGDEVGDVGFALNQLLDNVRLALEARSRVEEGMRAFIADASHELRTPLAAIRGYADMLAWTENLTDQGRVSVTRVVSQTERMSHLVEDLLLLARLDQGREPELAPVDLTELLMESLMDMQASAPGHSWRLEVPETPVEVSGDRGQIQQVLLNLLSNARKHTDEGTCVTASLSEAADGSEVLMSVTDNGPGIDPAFQGKIFDRFSRADAARSGSEGTSGLGLPIAQAIVQAHGGSLDVISRPGFTRFTARLPKNLHEGG